MLETLTLNALYSLVLLYFIILLSLHFVLQPLRTFSFRTKFPKTSVILQIQFALPKVLPPVIFCPTLFYPMDLHLYFKPQLKCRFLFNVLNSPGRVSVLLFCVYIAFCSYLNCTYQVVLQLCFFQALRKQGSCYIHLCIFLIQAWLPIGAQ